MTETIIGIGLAAGAVGGGWWIYEAVRRRLWPEPPPARYRVQIFGPDDWPCRTFRLTAQQAGRLVADLERDEPRDGPQSLPCPFTERSNA